MRRLALILMCAVAAASVAYADYRQSIPGGLVITRSATSTGANDSAGNPIQSPNVTPWQMHPAGSTQLNGNAAGTTGAVVGTLAAAANVTTYICGFNVQAIGGTAAVGPITVAGLSTSQIYQGSSSAAGGTVAQATFNPCLPASAVNTAITITTTANGTATAVNVNSWGYRK